MAPSDSEPTAGAWQFSLRELLALTTFAAVAAALAAVMGRGVFVVAAGLFICYLNARGAFARWQRGKWRWLCSSSRLSLSEEPNEFDAPALLAHVLAKLPTAMPAVW